MKQVNENNNLIGIAISEDELNCNIQTMVIAKSVLELAEQFAPSESIKVLINCIDSLEADYRGIYEKHKGKKSEVEYKGLFKEDCEVCD